jgi:hypothetical protein
MMVDETTSLLPLFRIKKANDIRKQQPQIKASRDKNNSQRMDDFHLK